MGSFRVPSDARLLSPLAASEQQQQQQRQLPHVDVLPRAWR
eukprot:CAMPEP_0194746412 /NCGR_PEP_ID=MMETSP0323_2-20130528/337_1 /TAXON_ID=2866 ORGANISM="Crypthecodinium cohnii, Strain Seligo" /NCGR_SAMPLE_ID=MMETSP0323_2 /ASSEMBLY_ACC=CAM_ASM_000346 /LENGTH=40 /DNA_ID= /DNA_START= /DNA_END= /DNA_ORIENTATION=